MEICWTLEVDEHLINGCCKWLVPIVGSKAAGQVRLDQWPGKRRINAGEIGYMTNSDDW